VVRGKYLLAVVLVVLNPNLTLYLPLALMLEPVWVWALEKYR
jgi:hypothetical protein